MSGLLWLLVGVALFAALSGWFWWCMFGPLPKRGRQ